MAGVLQWMIGSHCVWLPSTTPHAILCVGETMSNKARAVTHAPLSFFILPAYSCECSRGSRWAVISRVLFWANDAIMTEWLQRTGEIQEIINHTQFTEHMSVNKSHSKESRNNYVCFGPLFSCCSCDCRLLWCTRQRQRVFATSWTCCWRGGSPWCWPGTQEWGKLHLSGTR